MKKSLVIISVFTNVIDINCCTCGNKKTLLKAFGIKKSDISEHFKYNLKEDAENNFVADLSEEEKKNIESKCKEQIENGGCIVNFTDGKKKELFILKCSKDSLKINNKLITKSANEIHPDGKNKYLSVMNDKYCSDDYTFN